MKDVMRVCVAWLLHWTFILHFSCPNKGHRSSRIIFGCRTAKLLIPCLSGMAMTCIGIVFTCACMMDGDVSNPKSACYKTGIVCYKPIKQSWMV